MRQTTRLTLAMLMATCLIGTAAACSSPADEAAPEETAPEDVVEILDQALAGPTEGGDDERVFGATRDIVITAVESTFESEHARATWDGDTLRVEMDGSVDEPTASIPCLALEALLADGEAAIIVFADGDLICAERFD